MDIDVDNEVHTRVADVSTAHAMCDDVAQSSDMDLGDEAHARTSDADGATAAATSDADTGINADTDPSPVVFASPTAEHISSFLLHIRRRTADDATSSSPDVDGDTADGTTATAASAADSGMGGATGASATEAGVAVHAAVGATAQSAPTRKRKRKYAPANTERRQQRRGDRRDPDDAIRAPGSGGAQTGGDERSRV